MWNLSLKGHRSRPVSPELIETTDLILVMSPHHGYNTLAMDSAAAGKIFLLKNFPEPGLIGEGIEDPIGHSLDVYNSVFLEIGEQLGRIMPIIVERVRVRANAS